MTGRAASPEWAVHPSRRYFPRSAYVYCGFLAGECCSAESVRLILGFRVSEISRCEMQAAVNAGAVLVMVIAAGIGGGLL